MSHRFANEQRRHRAWTSRLVVGATIGSLWLWPAVHFGLVLVNLVASTAVLALQAFVTSLRRVKPPQSTAPVGVPFVSIHVPAHDEPPELLIETLRSLAQLDWPSYEVLVIDNNTSDPNLWRPVEAACRELGSRFRFLHVEGLPGAKAGALNWARQFVDARAKYAFVVDADYQVRPDCLRRAFVHVTHRRVALVQFPQHYRNVTRDNAALALEFRHFFASYMHAANRLDCVPSTGTLTLIDLDALRTVGGFDSSVITEDAELGFRMLRRGYRAIFVDEPVGAGLLPLDLAGLKKQRWRWAFGNAQVLRGAWRELLLGRNLTRRQKLGVIAHMTAWFNFNLIPSLSLVVLASAAAVGRLAPAQHATIYLSAVTLVSFLVLRFVTLSVGLRRDGHRWRAIVPAFATHLGLGWIFSSSWVSCLWDSRSRFVRTNKFIEQVLPGQLRWMMTELATGVLLLAACASMGIADLVAGPLAALAFASIRFGIVWVWHQARATYEITARQIDADRSTPEQADAA